MHRKTHDIAGVTYSILGNCSIIVSGRIAAKLAKQILPALTGASEHLAALQTSTNQSEQLAAMGAMIATLDTELVYDAAFELVAHCKCFANDNIEIQLSDGGGKTNDAMLSKHFNDHPANLFPFLIWILQQECGGFFDLGKLSRSNTEPLE